MAKRKEIRNSTAEFLIFQAEDKGQGIEVIYKDENVWCTQKAMATLFDCSTDNVGLHLKNIFASGELVKDSVTEKISATASDGKNYLTQFYNLDAIISVGYRVNSIRATQFRQWATSVLRQYAICGYVIDRKRMENGTFLFFQRIQNKMHYAVHQHTAAELIVKRANADKEHMGLTTSQSICGNGI